MDDFVIAFCEPRHGAHRVRNITLTLVAVAIAGACTQAPMRSSDATGAAGLPAAPRAAPTSTARWNEYACELIARNRAGQFPAVRSLAYMNLAVNNATVEAGRQGTKPEGAAAGAAATVLAFFFPQEAPAIAARLSGETAALGARDYRSDFSAGVDIGREVGASVIAFAKADRASVAWTGTLPNGDDKWSSLAQPPAPPVGPQLGAMRTFFIASPAEFRAPPPPAIGSPRFKSELAQVRRIADGRTHEQLRIAQYWETLSGAFNAGVWNEAARGAISARGMHEAESARVLAMMHMAVFDANLACHESKYTYWQPRPTQMDPEIRLAIALPNHPSYPSNHACISGAAASVLDAMFPEQRGRYRAMAREAGESRILGGIHYRSDVEEGLNIAQKIVARALDVGIPEDLPFVPRGR
jgi:hypothetical protein